MEEQDVPKKRCTGPCQQEYPATTEFWYAKTRGKYGLSSHCKNCHHQQMQEYRRRPGVRAVDLERQKKYASRPEIKERARKQSELWHRNHPEKRREYNRRYYHSHPEIREKLRQYNKKRRLLPKVKEYRNRYNKEYQKEYRCRPGLREVFNLYGHNYRARKKSVEGTYTPEQIQEQLKRQKYRCYYAACGHTKFKKVNGNYQYHVEHTFPISRVAGTDIPANSIDYLVLACPSCNLSKHDKFPWEWPEGGRLC